MQGWVPSFSQIAGWWTSQDCLPSFQIHSKYHISNMGYQTRQRYECKFPVDSTERLARKHGIVGLFQMIGLPDGEISSLGFRHSHDVPWGIIDVSLSCYDWDGMSVWNGTGQYGTYGIGTLLDSDIDEQIWLILIGCQGFKEAKHPPMENQLASIQLPSGND